MGAASHAWERPRARSKFEFQRRDSAGRTLWRTRAASIGVSCAPWLTLSRSSTLPDWTALQGLSFIMAISKSWAAAFRPLTPEPGNTASASRRHVTDGTRPTAAAAKVCTLVPFSGPEG